MKKEKIFHKDNNEYLDKDFINDIDKINFLFKKGTVNAGNGGSGGGGGGGGGGSAGSKGLFLEKKQQNNKKE